MDLRTDSGPVGRPGKKRPAKAAPKQRAPRFNWREKLSLPDWQWPTLNIKLPPAEMGLSGVLRAALVALWHVPDRFNWLGPVSPFHRRWITVSALVVLLGIVLPSGSSVPEQSEAALPVAGAEGVQDNTPVALTPEALSERQPDRRIPQEMPEDLEQRSEAVPVSSPPVTRAAQAPSNTVRREAESKAPTRVADRAPERSVSKPAVKETSVKETPVKEAPVREVAKKAPEKAPEKVAEKKPVESAAKTSTAGWQSYQVGKGVTLAQVFRSGNLPLPDLMAMTRAQAADKPLSNVKAGQTVRVKTNAKGEVEALQLDAVAGSKPVVFVRLADGSFAQSQ